MGLTAHRERPGDRGGHQTVIRERAQVGQVTAERIDEADLASAAVDIRFAFGTRTRPIFREVTLHLAAVRDTTPHIVRQVGHVILYQPDAAAAYIRGHGGA